MKRKYFAIGIVIAALLALVIFKDSLLHLPNNTPVTSHGGPVRDYVSFIDTLRAMGQKVEPKDPIQQPFFTPKGQIISIDGEDIQVFEYSDTPALEVEAQKVSSDGSSIGTSMASWMGMPHFYKKEKILVIYIGNDSKIIQTLTSILGKQFAGR